MLIIFSLLRCTEMVKVLVEKKSNLTKEVDREGWTPLHYAAKIGNLDIAMQLLKADESAIDVRDKKEFMTPPFIAARYRNFHILQEFMSRRPHCLEHYQTSLKPMFSTVLQNYPLLYNQVAIQEGPISQPMVCHIL